eukprot:scpid109852/ scgid28550/ 
MTVIVKLLAVKLRYSYTWKPSLHSCPCQQCQQCVVLWALLSQSLAGMIYFDKSRLQQVCSTYTPVKRLFCLGWTIQPGDLATANQVERCIPFLVDGNSSPM